jgi:RNA polymerase sigma-70 factor (ECF subfamily)
VPALETWPGFIRNKQARAPSKVTEKGNSQVVDSDETLVQEFVRTGSRGAFAELYYRYKDKAFNTAFRIVGDFEGARDVVHDVFLKVYVEAPGFLFKSSFSSWFYRIVVNRSLDEARRLKRRKMHLSTESMTEELLSRNETEYPERAALGREAERELAKAVAGLSPKLKAVITLRYFEALTYEQIADIINRPVGTVKSRLRRAHKKLGEAMGDKGYRQASEGEYGLLDITGSNA